MNMESCVSARAPEKWVVNIRTILEKMEAAETSPVCILKVRKMLRDIKPEEYSPRLIGLGPYHHWRQDLYEMELYKLIAANKAVAHLYNEEAPPVQKLCRLVDGLTHDHIAQIRACYDRYLEVDDQELAWAIVIDTIFFLQFLKVCVQKQDAERYWRDHKRMWHLIDPTQSAYHSILRDIIMLENQIPTIALEHVATELNTSTSNNIIENDALLQLLIATAKKLSPFQHRGQTCFSSQDMPCHLLQLLYYMIEPLNHDWNDSISTKVQDKECPHPTYTCNKDADEEGGSITPGGGGEGTKYLPYACIADALVKVLGSVNLQAVRIRPLALIATLTRSLFPILSSSRESLSLNSSEGGCSEAPTIEEIEIPCVSQLLDVGVKLCPTTTDGLPLTSCISFNRRSKEFHLPVIDIDENTEVIMRNLVAYEAAAISGPLVLARYTELMNGIIDTPEDVKELRKWGIIKRQLKSDQDVCKMWNLMSRSIRLSHVVPIDKAIKGVNDYYTNKKTVRFCRLTKQSLLCTWKFIMFFFLLLLLMLLLLQSFCQVYPCPRIQAAIQGSGSQNTN